jgi:OFA family oxalate/formate antiporter-like MFS transporter
MGTALKWFPDKRGLAAGMIAAGYGLGAAITSVPLAEMIRVSGYRQAFHFFGLLQGLTICLVALLLVKPGTSLRVTARKTIYQGSEHNVFETFRSGVFWLIYAIYLLIALGGMIVTAQLGPIARDFGLEARTVVILGFSVPLVGWAVSIDNFANGITRPISGLVSDVIGRENAMLMMFSLEAVALFGLAVFGRHPYAFLVFAALIFLFWGEIFVLFPAICGDCFGSQNAAANNGLLYTAKGTSAIAVPLASLFVPAMGTWTTVLIATAFCSAGAGLLAKFVLGPMRRRVRSAIDDPTAYAVKC